MNPPSEPISIAFFGSTGGCTNACLAHTLKAGIKAVALVRNQTKLTTLLNEQGIDHETISKYLTIVEGNAMDVSAVKRTIAPEQNHGALVSSIITGIGGGLKFQASITQPIVPENINICAEAMETLIKAARELVQQQQGPGGPVKQPLLTMISTTGISEEQEDVPYYMRAFYHHILGKAHADKGRMEELAKATMNTNSAMASHGGGPNNSPFGTPNGPPNNAPHSAPNALPNNTSYGANAPYNAPNDHSNSTPSLFKGLISIRPSLLKGDHLISTGKGWENLRVGTEANPAVGCAVYRSDVGQWMFEEIVRRGGEKWIGEAVTLTK